MNVRECGVGACDTERTEPRFVSPTLCGAHPAHASRLRERAQAAERDRQLALAVLDRLDSGVVMVDGQGRVRHANRLARSILDEGDGLSSRNGLLACHRADDSMALRRAVFEVAAGSGKDPVLCIRRPAGRRPLSLRVISLHGPGTGATGALVLFTDPERLSTATVAGLCHLYALTKAEARIALALASASKLADVAETLSVSLSTVRTLLGRVFEKTGTHRQADLVRLLIAHRPPGTTD